MSNYEIPKDILQRIDDETDLVALVSEFISLEKKGKNYFGLCPFHDDSNPSFSVTTEKNIAMCMTCKGGGRPINFYREIKNIPFRQAAIELGERLGIKIDGHQRKVDPNEKYYEIMEETANFYQFNLTNSKSGEVALKYLADRMLSEETIKNFKLGFARSDKDMLYQLLRDKNYNVSDMIELGLVKQANDGSYYDMFINRLVFPITNSFGKTVGFSGRSLEKNSNHKYVNSPETVIFRKSELLYNFNEATQSIKRLGHVILYEGFFDVISSFQQGFYNSVANMGTALTNNQARLIKSITNKVIIAFDGDKAGINAAISAIKPLESAGLIVEVLKIPNKLDPDDYLKQFGPDSFDRLFLESKYDPYAYLYEHYKDETDFNNANDIKSFKNNVEKMLSSADVTIKSLYSKRLSKDLNIDIKEIKIIKEQPKELYYEDYKEINVIKPKAPSIPDKYENAERRLIYLMIRSRTWFERIKNELSLDEYSTLENGAIRNKLRNFYDRYEVFDLTEFKALLATSEREYLETVLFQDDFWRLQTTLEDSEINEYIGLIKTTTLNRRKTYLENRIIELSKKSKNFTAEIEEIEEIKEKLKKTKNGGI